ncbi:MAG: amidinotransferase, partial [Xanthomonadaceae bacterium]|nr:amidinotransferase [Xanthomonadaceae bacterium]
MIRPVRFMGNPQTSASNAFQQRAAMSADEAQRLARAEFDDLAERLASAGVGVHVIEDTLDPHTPDSIFPNNWVSFHADGTVVLYPMLAPNRRAERRADVLEALSAREGFFTARIVDLSHHEREGKFLEGTGSLVLDRTNRVAYACLSARTDLDVLGDFAQQLDYDVVAFEATDSTGFPIYHTNVLMCVGTGFAAVCSAAIRENARAAVLERLRAGGRALLELSYEQMHAFAGNMLELRTSSDKSVIAMSTRAFESLSREQRHLAELHADSIVSVPIPTIENLGGGSVRCM